MNMKEDKYYKLVEKCKEYNKCNIGKENKKVKFNDYEKCNEINLWTYWQGRGHINTTKILLVGQDWGCPTDKLNIPSVKNVERIEEGEDIPYLSGDNKSVTDRNLIELFYQLGYDIEKRSSIEVKNRDLFFTNLITGYRSKGTSGSVGLSYIDKECMNNFRKLVEILEPKFILCLGKLTYKGVVKSMGLNCKVGNYNKYIDDTLKNPKEVILKNGRRVNIFPLAHCGKMGTLNRARSYVKDGEKLSVKMGLKKQKEDWSLIKTYLL